MNLEALKKEKAKCKAAFTRNLQKLSNLLDKDIELPSRREVKEQREKLSDIQEDCSIYFLIFIDYMKILRTSYEYPRHRMR